MKPEDMVPTLQLALALKLAGYPQSTMFAWRHSAGRPELVWTMSRGGRQRLDVAAPTVAEMGTWLPRDYGSKRCAGSEGFAAGGPEPNAHFKVGTTEADVRARLLISLAAAGVVKPREVIGRVVA